MADKTAISAERGDFDPTDGENPDASFSSVYLPSGISLSGEDFQSIVGVSSADLLTEDDDGQDGKLQLVAAEAPVVGDARLFTKTDVDAALDTLTEDGVLAINRAAAGAKKEGPQKSRDLLLAGSTDPASLRFIADTLFRREDSDIIAAILRNPAVTDDLKIAVIRENKGANMATIRDFAGVTKNSEIVSTILKRQDLTLEVLHVILGNRILTQDEEVLNLAMDRYEALSTDLAEVSTSLDVLLTDENVRHLKDLFRPGSRFDFKNDAIPFLFMVQEGQLFMIFSALKWPLEVGMDTEKLAKEMARGIVGREGNYVLNLKKKIDLVCDELSRIVDL